MKKFALLIVVAVSFGSSSHAKTRNPASDTYCGTLLEFRLTNYGDVIYAMQKLVVNSLFREVEDASGRTKKSELTKEALASMRQTLSNFQGLVEASVKKEFEYKALSEQKGCFESSQSAKILDDLKNLEKNSK